MIAVKSVINKIRKSGLTISFAESCSGGNIAAEVIKISGVSDIFMGGVVTYSDEAKIDVLKLTKQDINKFGVVSENIAFLMAKIQKNYLKHLYPWQQPEMWDPCLLIIDQKLVKYIFV